MGELEALTVEGRCTTWPGQSEINDPSVAEITLFGLLVLCPGCVASQAGLGPGNREHLQIVRPLGLVTECASEGWTACPNPRLDALGPGFSHSIWGAIVPSWQAAQVEKSGYPAWTPEVAPPWHVLQSEKNTECFSWGKLT